MHGDTGGVCSSNAGIVVDGDQVRHLERGPGDVGKAEVHVDHVVEFEWLAVLHERLEHRRFEAGIAPLGERVADRTQVLDPGLLEVGEVVAVVHDAHRIGLDETHPDPVDELVVVGRGGRIDGQTHAATIQVPDPSTGPAGPFSTVVPVTPAVVALQDLGIAHTIHEYDRGDDLRDFGREAADALGLDRDQVFKTLVVVADDDELVVAIVPVSCQLSMKRVAAAAGAKKATMCDPAVAERSSGYVVGGISPIGQRKQLRTLIDETAELFDTVYVSGGKRGMDIGLAPADLIAVLDAIVAPITA